jgi:hypothetical protein
MTFMDDPFSRDLKRIEIARRMVCHQARTQTITQFTNITRNRLAALRKRWCVSQESRRRGPPPRSIATFLRTPRARSEAAAIASLCIAFDALTIPVPGGSRTTRPPLVLADRLCETYEAYLACIPDSKIEFEELLLLAHELAKGDMVRFGVCKGCKSAVLVLAYDPTRRNCLHCNQ